MADTSFDKFAEEYDKVNQDTGDYTHENTIDPALFECIGNIKGLKVYELACGNGYNARRMVKEGADEVWAFETIPLFYALGATRAN
jgi:ubiquinone/menaquinone biosynthesis C-methylase UbiE